MRSIFLSHEQVFDKPLPIFKAVGAAASALVDVWKAFAGPDTPSAAEESHAESAEKQP